MKCHPRDDQRNIYRRMAQGECRNAIRGLSSQQIKIVRSIYRPGCKRSCMVFEAIVHLEIKHMTSDRKGECRNAIRGLSSQQIKIVRSIYRPGCKRSCMVFEAIVHLEIKHMT